MLNVVELGENDRTVLCFHELNLRFAIFRLKSYFLVICFVEECQGGNAEFRISELLFVFAFYLLRYSTYSLFKGTSDKSGEVFFG